MELALAFLAGAVAGVTAVAAGVMVVTQLCERYPREVYMTGTWLRELHYRLGKE